MMTPVQLAETFLILLTFAVAVLGIFLKYKWKKSDRLTKALIIFLILSAIITGFIQWEKYQKENKLELVAASFGKIDIGPNVFPAPGFMVGLARFASTDSTSFQPFITRNGPLIEFYVKDNKLKVNAALYDLKGSAVAAVTESEWTVYDNNYEYNNSDNAFEIVRKGDRHVFFQIEYRDSIVHLAGYLLDKDTLGYLLYYHMNGHAIWRLTQGSFYPNVNDPFEQPYRLFKYPRSEYLGVREPLPTFIVTK